ncbi:hypothetical protein Tco_0479265 [Tanacetum coccineum]
MAVGYATRIPCQVDWVGKSGLLDVARTEVALAVLYLTKAEARDQICRAIKYGQPRNINSDFSPELNLHFVNDSHPLISPTAPGTHLPICWGNFTFSLLPQTLKVYIEEENMIGVCGLWNIAAFMVVTGSDHQGEKAS